MLNLKDLKENILSNKIDNFYIFYGEDFGLRKHYIDKLKTYFDTFQLVYNIKDLQISQNGNGLFKMNTLYIVPGDDDFAKQNKSQLNTFVKRIGTDCVVLDYEDELPNSTLFQEYQDHITYFPVVKDNIAYEFIDSEVSLIDKSKKELAENCKNNYNAICIESDKIKNYAKSKNINEQLAYETLDIKQQLLYEYPPFNSNFLMNDILQGDFSNLVFWKQLINNKYYADFWKSLDRIYNDYIIAYLVKEYGKYDGSSKAYQLKFNWGRTKEIREFNIPYSSNYILDTVNRLCELDFKVKCGLVDSTKVFDYFISIII